MKNHQKGSAILVVIIIIILLIIIGAILYLYTQSNHDLITTNNGAQIISTTTQDQTTSSSNQGTSLKTYSTTGFSIQYPSTWSVTNPSSSRTDFMAVDSSKSSFTITVYNYGNGTSDKTESVYMKDSQILAQNPMLTNFSESTTSINGIIAGKIVFDENDGTSIQHNTQIVVEDTSNKKTYIISTNGSLNSSLFTQIYNSFVLSN